MVLEESIWLYWLAIVILALLLVAHVLLIPPPRPKFASKTAEWACYFRYVAWLDAVPELHIEDAFAAYFVRPSLKVLARLLPASLRRRFIQSKSSYALGWVVARTKFYDDVILQRAAEFEQLVILGAGFDCRAYRLALPSQLAVFEVDRPETQAYKRAHIQRAAGVEQRLRNQVTFAPVNFNIQRLEDQLPAAGYSRTKKTLFLWEAVTQYISADAVDNVLRFIKENSASGSIVCFDFKYKEAVDGTKNYSGIGLKTFVGQENEPYLFGIPEGRTAQFLSDRGLHLEKAVTPDQLAKYVASPDFTYFIPGFQEIVIAKVP